MGGNPIRKGKAMLQRHTNNNKTLNRPYDLQGIIMPSADKAEWLIFACLNKDGSSGCLGPGVSLRILE